MEEKNMTKTKHMNEKYNKKIVKEVVEKMKK